MPDGSDLLAQLSEFPDELVEGEVVIDEVPRAGGNFADVLRATYRGQPVAIKALRRMKDVEPESMNRKVQRESRAWWQLKHENVLPLLGFVDKPKLSPYKLLVSPWCEHGSLADVLEKNPDMTMKLRLDLFYGMTKGLNYLHTGKSVVVHGDLKPANILIDSNWIPRLCDFGLVRIIHEGPSSGLTTTSNHLGTTRYLAPELLAGDSSKQWWAFWKAPANAQVIVRPTAPSDVHALGSIGMEIMTGIKPYEHITGDGFNAHLKLLSEIKSGSPPARRPSDLEEVVKIMWRDVFEATWRKKAKKRPTAGEVCVLLEGYRTNPEFQE